MSGLDGLGIVANVFAVVDLSAKVIGLCAQYARDVKSKDNDKARLLCEVTALFYVCDKIKSVIDGPQGSQLKVSRDLPGVMATSQSLLRQLHNKLATDPLQFGTRQMLSTLHWPFQKKDVERIIKELRQCKDMARFALQVDQTNVLLKVDRDAVLSRLPIVSGAAFDSKAEEHNPHCLPETRVEILQSIATWASDPATKSIFWLNGMAGTGKSTISRTAAQSFADKGYLKGSFLFKRGEGDRSSLSKFFTTIAADLIIREPGTAYFIKEELDTDPAIVSKTAREQFEKLFYGPLAKVATLREDQPAVIVIDALDECAVDDDIRLLVHLLSRIENIPIRLKILVTSRPDLHPRLAFQDIHGAYQDAILEKVAEPTIRRDINMFLKHELSGIKSNYNKTVPKERQLRDDWPDIAHIQALSELATPLFIFAATACRFISDRRSSPEKQLLEILSFHRQNTTKQPRHIAQLEATYMPVLHRLIVGLSAAEQDEAIDDFKLVIGPLVTLFKPLSADTLALLLQIPLNDVALKLDFLHSVLSVPASSAAPVRLMHLSFRDFLVNASSDDARKFRVQEDHSHEVLFLRCIDAMQTLRQDLCDMSDPGTLRLSIPKATIGRFIPPVLEYACRYWIFHLEGSGKAANYRGIVFDFVKSHLLHWLEALSLLGEAAEAVELMGDLVGMFKDSKPKKLHTLLLQAQDTLRSYVDAIDTTPLQLYSSFIIFSPTTSLVRWHFQRVTLQVLQPEDTGWNYFYTLADNRFKGHERGRVFVCFSPDSSLLASASEDGTIRLWSLSGKCLHVLEGHEHAVTSICFSPDSKYIASISEDRTIRIWSAELGHCIYARRQRCHSRSAITFSPDSSAVAIGCLDNTLRLWNIELSECITVYEGANAVPYLAELSPDASLLAACSLDYSGIHIWKFASGEYIKHIEYDADVQSICFRGSDELLSVASDGEILAWQLSSGHYEVEMHGTAQGKERLKTALSRHQHLLALGSQDNIHVWDLMSKRWIDTIRPPNPAISSLAFHGASKLLASGSHDGEIRTWQVIKGSPQEMMLPASASSFAIAPGGRAVAVAELGTTCARITLREPDSSELIREITRDVWYDSSAFIMSISPDSQLLAAAATTSEVRIWNLDSEKCIGTIDFSIPGSVTKIQFSDDSTLVAVFSAHDKVAVYEVGSGAQLHTFRNRHRTLQNPSLSPDMKLLVAENFEAGEIQIMRLATEEHVLTVACESVTGHMGFSPDGKLLTLAGPNSDVSFWRVETGQCSFRGNLLDALSPDTADPEALKMFQEAGMFTRPGHLATHSPLYIYAKSLPSVKYGYGISADRCWVTWNGARYVWLPPEARPDTFQIADELVVLLVKRQPSRVIVMRFLYTPSHISVSQ